MSDDLIDLFKTIDTQTNRLTTEINIVTLEVFDSRILTVKMI